jgi:hypothetical protein
MHLDTSHRHARGTPLSWRATALALLGAALAPAAALAHNVAAADRAALTAAHGAQPFIYAYLGAKHMVTGYDHLLFLLGVIFYLYRVRDVASYVTLFALGHSLTLIGGVLGGVRVNAYLVDAVIGFSVVYKAFENLGGFKALFGGALNTRAAVFGFGLFHGLGLATKIQDLSLSRDALAGNLVSFNVGVELGQLLALLLMVLFINLWRRVTRFERQAFIANACIMACGFVLMGYQLTGYFVGAPA